MRDLYDNITVSQCTSPQNQTGDTPVVSSIIDRRGYDSVLFGIAYGSLADAGATFTVLLEEGDVSTLSDAAAVADADLLGTEAAASVTQANDDVVRKLGYKGSKRYLRMTITPSGNAGNAYVSVVALLGNPNNVPVS